MKSSLCHQNFSPFSHDNYSSTARRRWANENIPMFTGTSARTNDGYISRKIITSIVWHPSRSNVILFGTRDGQISLRRIDEEPCPRVARLQGLRKRKSKYQYVNDLEWLVIAGIGRGATVTGLVFDQNDSDYYYSSYASGQIFKRDLMYDNQFVMLCDHDIQLNAVDYSNFTDRISETEEVDLEFRFASLDHSPGKKLLISGDNNGIIHFVSTTEEKTAFRPTKIHGGHILHCEFNPVQPNIIATSSTDGKVKLWDLRWFSSQTASPFTTLLIGNPVNCATFHPVTGASLLVNDNCDKLQHFVGPNFSLDWEQKHEHRQVQQIATIKVSWHPVLDVAVIGYADDEGDGSAVDLINVLNGRVTQKLIADVEEEGIMSINKFSNDGTSIVSSLRRQYAVWRRHEP